MRGRRTIAGILAVGLGLATGCGALKRCAYSSPGRDGWQQPERVVTELEIRGGERVADLGAGGGYFTFRLADAVGPEGTVYAVDVDEETVTGELLLQLGDPASLVTATKIRCRAASSRVAMSPTPRSSPQSNAGGSRSSASTSPTTSRALE